MVGKVSFGVESVAVFCFLIIDGKQELRLTNTPGYELFKLLIQFFQQVTHLVNNFQAVAILMKHSFDEIDFVSYIVSATQKQQTHQLVAIHHQSDGIGELHFIVHSGVGVLHNASKTSSVKTHLPAKTLFEEVFFYIVSQELMQRGTSFH